MPREHARDRAAILERLEAQLAENPDDSYSRSMILDEYLGSLELHCHPRRIEHILALIRSDPHDAACFSPLVAVSPEHAPEAYSLVEAEWNRQLEGAPDDPKIVRGVALFVFAGDPERAKRLLVSASEKYPDNARVWLDLARMTKGGAARIPYLQQARRLGGLAHIAWIGEAAVEAGNWELAESISADLFADVAKARATYGDKLDWTERGTDLWERACKATGVSAEGDDEDEHDDDDDDNETGGTAAASALVRAISKHADQKHWAHTVAGHVALERGDIAAAIEHLFASSQVVGGPRLGSYGPSPSLAEALCKLGKWNEVEQYWVACSSFWEDDRLTAWLAAVRRHELPASKDA
jgi:hypothetical protein